MRWQRLSSWAVGLVLAGLLGTAEGAAPVRGSAPDDPLYQSRGSWGQDRDDQWALKRVGFGPRGTGSAWDLAEAKHDVVVAVLDTGLDYHHPDLAPESVWRNPREQPNGRDDDGNGFVDDLIGWNFIDGDNNPWDRAGHGTHVAGIIAAATGNGEGVAGVNPRVKIMPLKVMNFLGRGRSSGIAAAIYYAVGNGARLINLSLGSHHLSRTEQRAIDWAWERNALVVVAAGNSALDIADYGPAGLANVITVAATGPADERTGFSNWGEAIDIAAPGVDVLSLRARRTDFLAVSGAPDYAAGDGFVGPEARYYTASGTSFAAPFVTGVASLLLSVDPGLTNQELERMLLMSADDVEAPGWDRYTGFGRLNAAKALRADPGWYLVARISQVAVETDDGRQVVSVRGSAAGSDFESYVLELGRGAEPERWQQIGDAFEAPVEDGRLGAIPVRAITSAGTWAIRVVARDRDGRTREARGALDVAGGP